jgi:hypothetical protein
MSRLLPAPTTLMRISLEHASRSSSCPYRFGGKSAQLAFYSVAPSYVLRTAGRRQRSEVVPGMVHPRMACHVPSGVRDRTGTLAVRAMASLYIDTHQQDVSVKRHFSRISPAFPSGHSLRRFSRARRHSPFCFALRAPLGSGFPNKNLPRRDARGGGPNYGRDFSSEPPQKARLRPWERGTSRRFAQECPEGNPGKYKQGETPWHSTKIK